MVTVRPRIASGLKLLRIEPATADNQPTRATVFASQNGIGKLRQRSKTFGRRIGRKRTGRKVDPSMQTSCRASLRSSRRDCGPCGAVPTENFPKRERRETFGKSGSKKATAADFIASAPEIWRGHQHRIDWSSQRTSLSSHSDEARPCPWPCGGLGGVPGACGADGHGPDYFRCTRRSRSRWIGLDEVVGRTTFHERGRHQLHHLARPRRQQGAPPLIAPALAVADRHAADPSWGLEDTVGHGTQARRPGSVRRPDGRATGDESHPCSS